VRSWITIVSIIGILTVLSGSLYAQQKTKKDSLKKESLTRKAFHEGMGLISTSPRDTTVNEKSTDPFAAYTGKIIRQIHVNHFGFEKSIYDSAKKLDKLSTKVANAIHVDTKGWIIRQHLFIKENEPLNPYKLSDNERFIRDKDFIIDCRIVVTPIEGTDSVDLTVVTRDVFSIGGTLGGTIPTSPKIGVYDANVLGRAQRVEYTSLFDPDRSPTFGWSLLYRKSSVFGTLANLELQYTQLNSGRSTGQDYEYAVYARLSRPLVSPYARLAGGLEVSQNWSRNVYRKDSIKFRDYRYNIFDIWMGYNFGIHRKVSNRNRQFLAVRYLNRQYLDQPDQPQYLEETRYNSARGALAEFTWYRQDFYKTRYVFGFGRTEDIPEGFSLGLSGGYIKEGILERSVERPYTAVKFNFGEASRKGNFYRLVFQSSAYIGDSGAEDAIVQGGAAYFTRALQLNRYKARSVVSVTYTQLFNRTVIPWLDLTNRMIPGFKTDSLIADSRLAVHLESALYTPWLLLGFRFAPFAAVDMVSSRCVTCDFKNGVYSGFTLGLRTRNENLIFGTVEVKATYIPADEFGDSKFSFSFKQNLRVKNSGTFVRAPSLITYN